MHLTSTSPASPHVQVGTHFANSAAEDQLNNTFDDADATSLQAALEYMQPHVVRLIHQSPTPKVMMKQLPLSRLPHDTTAPHRNASHHTTASHTTPHYTTPHHTTPHHTTPQHNTTHHTPSQTR